MFNSIRNYFINKKLKKLKCKTCEYKMSTGEGWHCKLKYINVKKVYSTYQPICGKQRIKKYPHWCPLKEIYNNKIR